VTRRYSHTIQSSEKSVTGNVGKENRLLPTSVIIWRYVMLVFIDARRRDKSVSHRNQASKKRRVTGDIYKKNRELLMSVVNRRYVMLMYVDEKWHDKRVYTATKPARRGAGPGK
jgi:hypothetical protein